MASRTHLILWLAAALMCFTLTSRSAEPIILHLKSGDRITGIILSENPSGVILSNHWNKALAVPRDEILRREPFTPVLGVQPPPATNTVTGAKAVLAKNAAANILSADFFQHWKGEAQIGLDLIYNTADQQIYHGRLKLNYDRPYKSDPKKVFKNDFDYLAEYGKITSKVNGTNQTVKSSDRMSAKDKTAFDIHGNWYAYNLAGIGYDQIKNIDLQFEEGPGAGYHLVTRTNFTMNLEAGANYQVQDRQDTKDSRDFFFRLAEDFKWKIHDRTTLTEKFEFFPRVDLSEYRLRFESTVAYELWKNILLNFTVLEVYESQPAPDISANELQIRSSLGVKF